MLQKNQQHREGTHPPLPQSLRAPTIRKTVPEHQSPLRQAAQQLFPPGCESPEPKSPRPPLKKPMQTPTSWNTDHPPPPLQTLPNLTTPKKKLCELFCAIQVCYTQVSGPVQTTCSNTLSSMRTRHFFTHCCVHNPTKDSAIYACLHAHALQIILYCSPASCLTHNVSLCTCTVFMWSIRIVCIFYL